MPDDRRPLSAFLKRTIDIVGSLIVLAISSPVLLAIAAIIKSTSRGPVLFRQERVGMHGRRFTMLKFRSMRVDADPGVHEQYVDRFIGGRVGSHDESVGTPPYKLSGDPRVAPFGRLLRRTSLDELPQLLNVLGGSMSLVGPRPPIPYEVSRYAEWHMARLDVKPGITGLWQVRGRSRVSFDDMVRMDIAYARSWSIWLDVKIMLETLRAVVSGRGAA